MYGNTHISRRTTTKLVDMVANGEMTWESIARAALNYMSEDEVKDMAIMEELIADPDDDEPD